MKELLQATEHNYSQRSVRQFVVTIQKYKQFNAMLYAIKYKNGRILIEAQARVSRRREYFKVLLNGGMPETPVLEWKE